MPLLLSPALCKSTVALAIYFLPNNLTLSDAQEVIYVFIHLMHGYLVPTWSSSGFLKYGSEDDYIFSYDYDLMECLCSKGLLLLICVLWIPSRSLGGH